MISDYCGLRIRTVTRWSRVFEVNIAKSGIVLTGQYNLKCFIGGYSANKVADRAILHSQSEVVERAYAFYELACDQINIDGYIASISWPSLSPCADLPAYRVLLGSHPLGGDVNLDATGLACRPALLDASLHSMLEVLERHYLVQFWYGDFPLVEILDHRYKWPGMIARVFGLDLDPPLPFVVATLQDERQTFLCGGSAFSVSYPVAVEHAMQEAILLADGVLCGDQGVTQGDARRLFSLRDRDLSSQRLSYIESRTVRWISADEIRCRCTSGLNLVRNVHASIGVLRSCPWGVVTRASSGDFETLPSARRRLKGAIVDDFFC